jgi:hypothetical protein
MRARLSVVILALMLALPGWARMGADPKNQTRAFTWSGGDVTRTFDFCVLSIQENNPNQGTTRIPYSVTGEVNGTAPFTLENGAGDTVPVTLEWRDLAVNNTETLSPGVATAEQFSGGVPNCPNGNNGRLVVTVAEADLVSAAPGTYSQTFDLRLANSGGGKPRARASISLDLTIPDSIQITQVDDINLGSFDGVSDMSASDSLCVYRRGGGDYGVTITGSGSGGDFTLSTGTSTIPFSVTWNDGTGAQTVDPGVLIAGLTNTYTAGRYCAGGADNNATLGVDVLANDINTAATETGTHTGTLTITVEMQ